MIVKPLILFCVVAVTQGSEKEPLSEMYDYNAFVDKSMIPIKPLPKLIADMTGLRLIQHDESGATHDISSPQVLDTLVNIIRVLKNSTDRELEKVNEVTVNKEPSKDMVGNLNKLPEAINNSTHTEFKKFHRYFFQNVTINNEPVNIPLKSLEHNLTDIELKRLANLLKNANEFDQFHGDARNASSRNKMIDAIAKISRALNETREIVFEKVTSVLRNTSGIEMVKVKDGSTVHKNDLVDILTKVTRALNKSSGIEFGKLNLSPAELSLIQQNLHDSKKVVNSSGCTTWISSLSFALFILMFSIKHFVTVHL